jgi:hypothetical protein
MMEQMKLDDVEAKSESADADSKQTDQTAKTESQQQEEKQATTFLQ